MADTFFEHSADDEQQELLLSLVAANNRLTMQLNATQHVLMSLLQTIESKDELKYYVEKCASAYLAYAQDIDQDTELTDYYQESIDEYLDVLGDTND